MTGTHLALNPSLAPAPSARLRWRRWGLVSVLGVAALGASSLTSRIQPSLCCSRALEDLSQPEFSAQGKGPCAGFVLEGWKTAVC